MEKEDYKKLFKPLLLNSDYSFNLNGEWRYRCVIQPKVSSLKIPIGNIVLERDIQFLSLLAHYEISLSLENIDKIIFIKNDSKLLKLVSGYSVYFKELINESCPEGFYRIPGYDKYAINKDGLIMNVKTLKLLKENIHVGYPTVALYNPVSSRFIQARIHVCLARTFIPNIDNKDTVNHIDGNKLNYKLDNLEWVTAKENHLHAISLDKDTRSTKCKLKDIYTGEIFFFDSINSASRWLGYGGSLPNTTVYKNGVRVPILLKRKYEFKRVDDCNQWFYDPKGKLKIDTVGPYELRNVKSKDVLEFNTMSEVGNFLGVSKARIYTACGTNGERSLNGFQIRKKSTENWCEPTRDTRFNKNRVFTIYNVKTGELLEIQSKLKLSKFLRVDKSTVDKRLSDGKTQNGWKVFEMSKREFSPDLLSPRPL